MKLGLYLRNMGPQSTVDTLVECTRGAEAAGIDDLWVADHIAIPPDDAAGSGGRYLDPLATLAAEVRAVGIERAPRAAITDATLEFVHRCFAADEVELNGQRFLFLPRLARPPIFVGGAAPKSVRSALSS